MLLANGPKITAKASQAIDLTLRGYGRVGNLLSF
jgi:hypothetical protein